jgi:hypothetical protein
MKERVPVGKAGKRTEQLGFIFVVGSGGELLLAPQRSHRGCTPIDDRFAGRLKEAW